jgi:hypothetical protein
MATPTTAKSRATEPHTLDRVTATLYRVTSGKSGRTYEVRLDKRGWACECRGFYFNSHCSHADDVKLDVRKAAEQASGEQYKSVATRKGITLESLFPD